jgi:hypothetical protein
MLIACAGPAPSDGLTVQQGLARSSPDGDVPPSLIAALGRDRTYVEESCSSTTYSGWPYPAQRCTYRGNLVVTIANPSQLQVARWILDASSLIPALDQLRDRDRPNLGEGARESSRGRPSCSRRASFRSTDRFGRTAIAYLFERGVTKTCSTGCYCRVNSMSRQNWCAYAAKVLGMEDEAACLEKYGQTTSNASPNRGFAIASTTT